MTALAYAPYSKFQVGAAALFSLPLQVGAVRLGTLDLHRTTSGVDSMSLQTGHSPNNPLTPPPKDGWDGYSQQDQGSYGGPQSQYSQLSGGEALQPPRAPYAPPAPGTPNKRPNYSKLGTYTHPSRATVPCFANSRRPHQI